MDKLIGLRSGNLEVVEDLGVFLKEGTKHKAHYVKCKCDCGNEHITRLDMVKNNETKSCGCMTKHYLSIASRKHNEYIVEGDVIYVKMTNSDDIMLCDVDDLWLLEDYSWCKNAAGYAVGYIDGKQVKFHQMLYEYDKTKCVPDHINRNKLDNRKCNIQIIESRYNNRNISTPKDNKSGCVGVSFNKGRQKWIASIQANKKRIKLGEYKNYEQAVEVRKAAELKYWGFSL